MIYFQFKLLSVAKERKKNNTFNGKLFGRDFKINLYPVISLKAMKVNVRTLITV